MNPDFIQVNNVHDPVACLNYNQATEAWTEQNYKLGVC